MMAEIPESYETTNVYKDLDMSVFRGFVDKMAVKDLLDIHGNPNKILDSDDVAAIEGYDIYEYSFPDGNIDCYVKKGIDTNRALVEYIYYEPNSNIKLTDFVAKDSLRSFIQSKSSNVYYIGDKFSNIVRIRLANNDKSEIVNVALNDITQLDERKSVSTSVRELNEAVPIQFGDLGSISKFEFHDKELRIYITVSEHMKQDVLSIAKHHSEWASVLAIRAFAYWGFLRGMTSDLIREKTIVKFCLYGNSSSAKVESSIAPQSFRDIFENGVSNKEWLSNSVAFENLTLPQQMNEWLICGKQRIEDENLILTFGLKGSKEDFVMDEAKIKEHDISLLPDGENPDRDYISFCARCNYGIKKVYYFGNTKDSVEVVYSPTEIKKLLLKL